MHIEVEHPQHDSRYDLWPENRIHIVPDIGGDGEDYEVLVRGANAAAGVEGMSIEVGLRLGLGTKVMLDAMAATDQKRTHIAIDPFGDVEYAIGEDHTGRRDYTNQMQHDALSNLHLYAMLRGLHFLYLPLDDLEFFRRFADGVPTYDRAKRLETQYALVYLDGPHDLESVMKEAVWFSARAAEGAVMVFDDIQAYGHAIVDSFLLDSGWNMIETSRTKASYFLADVAQR